MYEGSEISVTTHHWCLCRDYQERKIYLGGLRSDKGDLPRYQKWQDEH
jgi:hypothetical protein